MARGRGSGTDRVRYRLSSTAVGLLVLAGFSFLLWLASDTDVLLAVATAIVVAIGIDGAVAWRATGPVTVDLRCADELTVGTPSKWTAQVHGWTRPITITPLLTPHTTDLLVPHGRLGALTWPSLRRGTVPFVVVDVVGPGPLGLVSGGRRHVVTLPNPVHVTPQPVETEITWPKARAIGFGSAEGSPIGDDLFRAVRPYRSGDERRRVHWKATAHHGELMVRESDGLGVVLVRLIVDLGLPGPGAELAAGRAAWVAAAAMDRGWTVELITLDATGEHPHLQQVGRTFGAPPILAPPPLIPLPTVRAQVRNAKEVRRRLATTASGTPIAPPGGGWRGLTCWVTRDGTHWS